MPAPIPRFHSNDRPMPLSSLPSDRRLSIAVCASREGQLLHRTLALLSDSMVATLKAGFRCDLTIVLHDADSVTATYARDREGSGVRVLELGDADRIEARNAAVGAVSGSHMAWLDAGDVCSRDWIASVSARALPDERDIVWHPRHCVVLQPPFQARECHDRGVGGDEPATFFWSPPYPYAAVAPRSLYQRFPFRPHDLTRGYLGGDWLWTNETLVAGIVHMTVPDTMVGILPDEPPGRINIGPPPDGLRPAPARQR